MARHLNCFQFFAIIVGHLHKSSSNGWKADILQCGDSDKGNTQTSLFACKMAAVLAGHPSSLSSGLFSGLVPRLYHSRSLQQPSYKFSHASSSQVSFCCLLPNYFTDIQDIILSHNIPLISKLSHWKPLIHAQVHMHVCAHTYTHTHE